MILSIVLRTICDTAPPLSRLLLGIEWCSAWLSLKLNAESWLHRRSIADSECCLFHMSRRFLCQILKRRRFQLHKDIERSCLDHALVDCGLFPAVQTCKVGAHRQQSDHFPLELRLLFTTPILPAAPPPPPASRLTVGQQPDTELFSTAYVRAHGHPAVSVSNAESSHKKEGQTEDPSALDEPGHSCDQQQQIVGAAELQDSLEGLNSVQHLQEAKATTRSATEQHNLVQPQQQQQRKSALSLEPAAKRQKQEQQHPAASKAADKSVGP
jgi:hypothetical protein